MFIREKYLKAIRGFYDSDLIKVITGIRRSGKSVILETIINEIKEKPKNLCLSYDDFMKDFRSIVGYFDKKVVPNYEINKA